MKLFKNKNIKYFIVPILFLGISYLFLWGAFIPFFQEVIFTRAIHTKNIQVLLNNKFIFNPYTNIQPEIISYFFDVIQRTDQDKNKNTDLVVKLSEKIINIFKKRENYFIYYPAFFTKLAQSYDINSLATKKTENYSIASEYYKKALDIFPNRQEIQYTYILDLLSRAENEKAIFVAKNAFDNDARILDSNYYYGISLASIKGDNYKKALDLMETSFSGDNRFSLIINRKKYLEMFIYFYQKKDIVRFRVVSSRLVEFDPERKELYQKIVEYINKENKIPYLQFE